jgi:hypothetical protein
VSTLRARLTSLYDSDMSVLSIGQLATVAAGFDFCRTAHATKVGAVSGGVSGMLLGFRSAPGRSRRDFIEPQRKRELIHCVAVPRYPSREYKGARKGPQAHA